MRDFRARLIVGLVAICLAAPVVGGRQVFRSAIEYVQLDVVVTDKKDRPVTSLTKDDFLVSEHGRMQSVATFDAVTIPNVHREVIDPKTTVPSIDVASNSAPPTGRQWVLVIDDLHIIELHIRQTQKLVQEFLQRLGNDDQVAVVFVGRSDLSQGFTGDVGAAMRTANRMKDALGFAYDAANNVGFGGGGGPKSRVIAPVDIGGAAPPIVNYNESERHRYAQSTIDVLNNVSHSLISSRFPRKALVYVSEGATYSLEGAFSAHEFDFSRESEYTKDFFEEMAKVFQKSREAGVPVYTIDPRGLPDGTTTRSGMGGGYVKEQQNNMRTLAENTGGLAFVNVPDITAAVEQLVHDNDTFYLVGFYPEPLVRDGKFHDVDVNIKNHPEYRVRARAGYSAPSAVPAPPADLGAAFNTAMSAALPESGIALRVFAAPVAPSNRMMKTAITLQVTYPADAGKLSDTLDYAISALDGDGKVKAEARKRFEFTASSKSSGDVTFVINDVIDLPPQPIALRVGVASHHLGKIGVIHTAVEAPKPTSDKTELGGIVIGYAGPAREEAKPKGALNAFIPFQPTTDRVFTQGDTIRIFAPVFWRNTGAVTVALAIRQGTKVFVERRDLLNPEVAPATMANQWRASFATALPMKGVPPGNYVLAITASGAGSPAKREVAFSVK